MTKTELFNECNLTVLVLLMFGMIMFLSIDGIKTKQRYIQYVEEMNKKLSGGE